MFTNVKINNVLGIVETNLINEGKLNFPFEGNFVKLDKLDGNEFEFAEDCGRVVYAFKSSLGREEVIGILREFGNTETIGDGLYIVSATDEDIVRCIYLGVEHLPEKADDDHIKIFARYMETLGIKTVRFLTV